VNEGVGNDGRRSRNLRIVEYDASHRRQHRPVHLPAGKHRRHQRPHPGHGGRLRRDRAGPQHRHQRDHPLERPRVPGAGARQPGFGVEDPLGLRPVGSKRVFKIDLTGATDVKDISLEGTNALPEGVTPVGKELYLDVQAALVAAGLPVTRRWRASPSAPRLADGSYALLIGTDNDFSVTQTGAASSSTCTPTARRARSTATRGPDPDPDLSVRVPRPPGRLRRADPRALDPAAVAVVRRRCRRAHRRRPGAFAGAAPAF
jgi:hypothetical protein